MLNLSYFAIQSLNYKTSNSVFPILVHSQGGEIQVRASPRLLEIPPYFMYVYFDGFF